MPVVRPPWTRVSHMIWSATISRRRPLTCAPCRALSDEATRQLALSYAIAGKKDAFEETLRPLLARDFASYRTRAFGFAILGDTEEGVMIAEAVKARMSQKLAPYLRYMPRLTNAQQYTGGQSRRLSTRRATYWDDPRIAGATSARRGTIPRSPLRVRRSAPGPPLPSRAG